MSRVLIAVSLILPVFAFAECGYSRDGNSMTIVVGKDPKCLSSESFRAELKAGIAEALAEEDARVVAQRHFDDRNARTSKLWALAERHHQATRPGARYFGQR